ncbi:MAG: nucleotidyltransferase domain-containing protein [Planctomycetes bacterium]|nr:nucleotidyltransferase domain-containing protein [Planctomycetota bacterium]
MTDAQKLEVLAIQAAARMCANPKVAAVLLTGSVAQGDVDCASDIDLIVYLHKAFSPAEYEAETAAAKASGGGVHFGDSGAGFGVYHYIGGRKVDFGIGLCSATDDLLDALLLKHDPNPIYQLVARGILQGRAIHGPEVIARWQARLRDYPDGLALATVKQCARFMPAWVMREMGARRDDAFLVYEHALQAVSGLCGILAALNRQYHPGKVKRLTHFAQGLQIAPRGFGPRARSVFGTPLPAAVDTLEALVRETLQLAETHLPQFDLAPVNQRYNAKLVRDE